MAERSAGSGAQPGRAGALAAGRVQAVSAAEAQAAVASPARSPAAAPRPAEPPEPRSPRESQGPREDWDGIQEQLAAGDRLAFMRVARLVSAVLSQLRAHDFRDEWDDLRQEVMAAVFTNARQGRLRDAQAFVGYVRIITRNKFVDRLKQRERKREQQALPWDEESARAIALAAAPPPGDDGELWAQVGRLPEPGRQLVEGIYREGHTYEEMAQRSGIPLGTLKRKLREALARLRTHLEDLREGERRGG
jgi:RNA polymerase sigma-70 factor (ECF subfamily)